ncbi:hypothetical protein NJD71_08700 [Psychrobacter sp. PP-21]|uniref:hypothetical protein n=1 Tax=Psychrobacter sp. PP-21 TaxID=2957503 RepID=UPI0029ADB160|nr:hypothetical protein [Psychrobacter sp. PP-21]MDX2374208.1 hypothetical protein [Psychrobacter sp. PP-21]
MEDTMSSYSFSHQFYQRWTCAPEPVRAAITQELKDITTLLQADTPFESFEFNTHDLDTHVDELYDNYNAEQAIAKAIADKQEQANEAAEKQRLEEEQKKETEKAALQAESELAEAAQKEQEKNKQSVLKEDNNQGEPTATDIEKINADKAITDSAVTDNSIAKTEKEASETQKTQSSASDNKSDNSKTINEQTHAISENHIKDIHHKTSTAINLVLKDAKLDITHQELIRELETQVDDYLSEQMMLLSENLKSWLRAEVTQHLSEQNDSTANNEAAKSIH